MLKHYLLIALRNLRRHWGYAAINVFGLAIGLAACILIAMFVASEFSFDRFHDNSDRLYRAWVFEDYGEDEQFLNTTTPLPLGPVLADTYPEIESYVRVDKRPTMVESGTDIIPQVVHVVDPNFFDVFSFPLASGSQENVLSTVTNAVLTQSSALKYFGDEDAIGKTISLQNGDQFEQFTVAGIAHDAPTESSIQFEILIPFNPALYPERLLTAWFNVVPETYILLREDATLDELTSKIPDLSKTILGDDYQPDVYNIGLQPIHQIHLDTSLPAGSEAISNPQYSYVMIGIALLILTIACVNFTTLAIGRSTGRSLEVGIRKVLGAQQAQVRSQFWGEAILMTVFALVAGLALANIALPAFRELSGRELNFDIGIASITFIGGLTLLVSLVAGSYPAVVLSGLRPMEVLKGKFDIKGKRQFVQRAMIVFQLSLSVLLVIGTLGMQKQLNFLQNTNLGFEKELAVVVPTNMPGPDGRETADRMREVLSADPSIVNVTASSFNIGDGWGRAGYTDEAGTYRLFWVNVVQPEYLSTLGIDLVQGRDYSRESTDDISRGILVNEALVAEYGWSNPIGQRLPGSAFGDHQIIGVVENFHYSTLRDAVRPLVMMANPTPIFDGIENYDGMSSFSPEVTIRFQATALPQIVDKVESVWNQVAPDQAFNYVFLDDAVDNQYRAEQRISSVVSLGTILSVIVACLGLFGLATLVTARRVKEIGIRKTMGASATGITMMISREFAVLATLAVVIASPLAFIALRFWLQEFAYRTPISVWIFVAAAFFTIAISVLTVGYQAIRAATVDPVVALRYE
ncbi:MAG: FtsX-like permease family protein [Rhodothermales bacterium]|nr:FtsX-like permease family protein [Rhodothermales bacterium]